MDLMGKKKNKKDSSIHASRWVFLHKKRRGPVFPPI